MGHTQYRTGQLALSATDIGRGKAVTSFFVKWNEHLSLLPGGPKPDTDKGLCPTHGESSVTGGVTAVWPWLLCTGLSSELSKNERRGGEEGRGKAGLKGRGVPQGQDVSGLSRGP